MGVTTTNYFDLKICFSYFLDIVSLITNRTVHDLTELHILEL
mgnify:CR=1 FL=1